jgi:hypothetical protein
VRYHFAVADEPKRRVRVATDDDEPPYVRYAFLNPYNLSLLAGATTTAAATGHWWIAVCAAATEGLWMLFAPGSKVLQAALWRKRWEQAQRDKVDERRKAKFALLTPLDQARAAALSDQRTRILQLASENQSLTAELMKGEIDKLDALLEDFLDLAAVCARCERQLGAFDAVGWQRSKQSYDDQVRRYPATDKRREVAQKNVEVLEQRRHRIEAMQRNLQTARGHMDLMENSFRLLSDEIVTMADPTELAARLDDLRIGVQAIRETTEGDDEEALYEEPKHHAS